MRTNLKALLILTITMLFLNPTWSAEKTLRIFSLQPSDHQKLITLKPKRAPARATYNHLDIDTNFTGWALDSENKFSSIGVDKAWKIFERKKNVVVGVVDTGIDPNHSFIRKNILRIKNLFQSKKKNSNDGFGVDFSDRTPGAYPTDKHGHGTHVSGIIKSVFPDVQILPLKYYNPEASGAVNLTASVAALNYAVDSNVVDIINYSGGGPEPSIHELRALKKAMKKGILVVAAAGNERSNIDDPKNAYYPASYGLPNIISVGAYDKKLRLVPSSNWGRKSVDVMAPGHKIRSIVPGKNRKAAMTGTSQATAFVSGVAALLKSQYPQLSYEDLKAIIVRSSVPVKSFKGKSIGGGRIDAHRALKLAGSLEQLRREKKKVMTQGERILAARKN